MNLRLLAYQLASVIFFLMPFSQRASAGTGWQHLLHNRCALLITFSFQIYGLSPARNSEFDKQ
jgi:hypothetical protein